MLCWILIFPTFILVSGKSFTIDYSTHEFLKDGKPFRYIAGQIEYFRIPPEYWEDRLMRLRHAGLNAIQIYVPWNFHETFENQFNFGGSANITAFIKLAQSQNLFVILRPGPYICAEWENGGLPYWLIKKKGIQLRVYNQPYISAVTNYFNNLLPLIKPLLYINGGNILMVQIENEYGSYNCDKKYLGFLRDLFKRILGEEIALYTTDGPEETMMKCGSVEGVFPTVDFRPVPENLINQFFNLQQKYSKGGPMVNSEFYPGWFNMWGVKGPYLPSTKEVLDAMTVMYNLNASFTIYLMHGGTNYGFWNGAEPEGAMHQTGVPLQKQQIPVGFMPLQQLNRQLISPMNGPTPSNLLKTGNVPPGMRPQIPQPRRPRPSGKPDEKIKDPSIAATAEYLSIYAVTVENVLRKSITHIAPSYIVEPRPISIGELRFTQRNVYQFVPKVVEEIKNKMPMRYLYITQTETDCLLQLTFDTKGPFFKAVVHFRFADISRVTVFGTLEAMKAYTAFKTDKQYQSDTLYFRKATEAINEVLEKYRSFCGQLDPEKLFKCVIGFLSQFTKTQKLPCRTCGSFIKDGAEVPLTFFGLGGGPVSVAHRSCASSEIY